MVLLLSHQVTKVQNTDKNSKFSALDLNSRFIRSRILLLCPDQWRVGSVWCWIRTESIVAPKNFFAGWVSPPSHVPNVQLISWKLSHSRKDFPCACLYLGLVAWVIIINITYPFTARIVGATHYTDDFTPSFLHFPLFSTALWVLPYTRPVHSLMLSSHLFLCLVFFPLSLCLARWFWPGLMNERHDHTTAVCISLWPDRLLDLGTDFLVGNMIFVWGA